jgi:fibronectin-binding autotransporter adhesin
MKIEFALRRFGRAAGVRARVPGADREVIRRRRFPTRTNRRCTLTSPKRRAGVAALAFQLVCLLILGSVHAMAQSGQISSPGALGSNDVIDWTQVQTGPHLTTNSTPLLVLSNNGLVAQLSTATGSIWAEKQGDLWNGNYAPGAPIIGTGQVNPATPIVVSFATPVEGAGMQFGYNVAGVSTSTAVLNLYDSSGNLIASYTQTGVTNSLADNSAPFIGALDGSADISKISIYDGPAMNNPGFSINDLLLVEAASAPAQLSPNPNPQGSSLLLDLQYINNAIYTNLGNITIGDGGSLTNALNAQFTNQGSLTNNGALTNNGTLANTGTFNNASNFNNTGTFNTSGTFNNTGDMTNSGLFNVLNGQVVNPGQITNNSIINNYGSIQNYNAFGNNAQLYNPGVFAVLNGQVTNAGQITNSGSFSNAAGLVNTSSGSFTNTGTFDNTGTVNNNAGGLFDTSGTATNEASGLIQNDGTLVNEPAALGLSQTVGALNDVLSGVFKAAGDAVLNQGTIVNTPQGSIKNAGDLLNTGTIGNAGQIANAITGVIVNDGTITNSSGATLTNSGVVNVGVNGTVVNQGTIYNQSSATQLQQAANASQAMAAYDQAALQAQAGSSQGLAISRQQKALLNDLVDFDNIIVEQHTGGKAGEAFESRRGTRLINMALKGLRAQQATPTQAPGALLNVSGKVSNAGQIDNSGNLIVASTGSIDGAGSYSQTGGATAVEGTLSQSSMSVAGGGLLFGSGTINSAVALDDAFLSPGNSPGTLTINGSLSMTANTIYSWEVDYQNGKPVFDQVVVNGPATVSGLVLATPLTSNIAALRNQPFAILTATGGVNGQFAGALLVSNSVFLTANLSYDPDDVYLTIARNGVSYGLAGVTPNQIAVGNALQNLENSLANPGNQPLLGAVSALDETSAAAAFDALSGELYASALTAAAEAARLPREAVLDRLSTPFGSSGPAGVMASAPVQAPGLAPGLQIWGQVFGAFGRNDGDGNAATLSRTLEGSLFGIDATFNDLYRIGLAVGYSQSFLNDSGRASDGRIGSTSIGLYGGYGGAALQLRGGAFYSFDRFNVSRSVAFSGFSDTDGAGYNGGTLQAFGEAGWRIALPSTGTASWFEPIAGLTALRVNSDGFTEAGGAAALTGTGSSYGFGASTLGARAEFGLGASAPLTLRTMLGWRHVFGQVNPSANLAFANTSAAAFSVAGAPIARDAMEAELGLLWRVNGRLSAELSYIGDIAADAHDHAVRGRIIFAF